MLHPLPEGDASVKLCPDHWLDRLLTAIALATVGVVVWLAWRGLP